MYRRSIAATTFLVVVASFGASQPKVEPKAPSAVPESEVPEAIREKLDEAKRKYRFVMSKLRGDMMEAFEKKEAEARDTGDKKAVDRVVAARTAFEKDGTLPTVGIATNVYIVETDKAKRDLAAAYTEAIKECVRAKRDSDAEAIEKEKNDLLKGSVGGSADDEGASVNDRFDLGRKLAGTEWEWDSFNLKLLRGGVVGQGGWTKAGLTTRWMAVDRRTVLLQIVRGRDSDKTAVLVFDEKLTQFGGFDFNGDRLTPKRKK